MASTAEIDLIDLTEVRSEGLGEKRPAENGDDAELEGQAVKKSRSDGGLVGDMKKVAEIVMVLAAMGKMRGGRSPAAVEKEMMAEARTKLAEVCEGFAPKDVFPRDAFGAVIEDLGLSKLREQRLGFRPPKMSIAEKLLLTKQKMEKNEEFSLHSAAYSSQRLQTTSGAAVESRGTSQAVRMFPSDKPSHASSPSGVFQSASPLGHVSATNSTPLPYQLPTSEVRPRVSNAFPSNNMGRDSSSLLPRVERPHFRLDGKSNGSSFTQVQANSSGDHKMVKTPTWSVQPQSASLAKAGSDNKVPTHTSLKVEGAADVGMPRMTPQPATSKSFITQTTSGNLQSQHQHLQGMNFAQAPPVYNSHNDIGKIVQKLLHPKLPEHPAWTPPSRDYMSKALTCQMCKYTVNEVETILVCDACEKGFHLKCLQPHNQKGIPKGEWHCQKCLTLSNGKPLPPKYGRVMRNINEPKMPLNTPAVLSSPEKKVGTSDEKAHQQKLTVNGSSDPQRVPTGTDNIDSHPASGLKMENARETQGIDNLSSKEKKDENPPSGTCPNNLMKISGPACASSLAAPPVERSCEEKLVAESKLEFCAESEMVKNSSNHLEALVNPQENDQSGLLNSGEIRSKQYSGNHIMVGVSEKPSEGETFHYNQNEKGKKDEQGVELASPVEISGSIIGAEEQPSASSDGSHDFHWVGDVLQVVDEKTHYQSCYINGVVYEVQDYALFRFNNDILMPSKIQAMWEDGKTRSRWVVVNRCYFPGDLPDVVGRPCTPESNEVYESNHEITVMADVIQGPCEVFPPSKFVEESERRTHSGTGADDGLRPLFLSKWFYDELKGLFRDVSC